MSNVSSVGSSALPEPAFYSYPSSTVAGLDVLNATGSPASTASTGSTGSSPATTSSSSPSSTSSTSSTSSGQQLSPYQTQENNLEQYDTAELLYASFLSPSASLDNTDAVLNQAAPLLDGSTPASTSALLPAIGAYANANTTTPTDATSTIDSLV